MMGQFLAQIVAVMRLEMKKTFLARRGLWVYFLAFAPALLFLAHSLHAPYEQRRLERVAAANPVSPRALDAISVGLSRDEVVERLGQPYRQRSWRRRGPDGQRHPFSRYDYTDGRRSVTFQFSDGELIGIEREDIDTLPISQLIFATSFQFYFLRLAIFFGCVGIFVNLFRGEMLDQSLHFYLLTPLRRETLLIGKYLEHGIAVVGHALAIRVEYHHSLSGGPGMGPVRGLPGCYGPRLCWLWQYLPGRGTALSQSHRPGGGGAAFGKRESLSSTRPEEDQHDFLSPVDLSRPGHARSKHATHDRSPDRTHGTGLGGDILDLHRPLDGSRAHGRRLPGSQTRDQLQYGLRSGQ